MTSIKDKNGAEIHPGSWFVFIRKSHPNLAWGAEHSIRMMMGKTAGDGDYTEYTNVYLDDDNRSFLALWEETVVGRKLSHSRYINNSVFGSYDILLIPDDVRDLGLKAVVSYLRLGGLEVPTEISKLINEDNQDER